MEKPVILSVEMEHKAYWDLKFLNFDESLSREKRKLQLQELEENEAEHVWAIQTLQVEDEGLPWWDACEEEFPSRLASFVIQLMVQIVSRHAQV